MLKQYIRFIDSNVCFKDLDTIGNLLKVVVSITTNNNNDTYKEYVLKVDLHCCYFVHQSQYPIIHVDAARNNNGILFLRNRVA